MKPDMESVIQKLLQQNANLTLANAQLQSVLEQYEKSLKDNKEK